jgi:YVTN family beta-propeller protein
MRTSPTNLTLCFLILIGQFSLCPVMFHDNADAQVDKYTLESIVNQTGPLNERAQIKMDGSPQYIFDDLSSSDTIYVVNFKGVNRNGTVTAIDTTTYNVKNIPVGINPVSIFGDLEWSNLIYVSNSGPIDNAPGSISVIDTNYNTVIKNIPVGNSPRSIFGDLSSSDLIYVPNYGSDTVSVIDTTNNTLVKNIPVGYGPFGGTPRHPVSIFGDLEWSDHIYVSNSGPTGGNASDSVSVIDTNDNTVIKNIPVGNSPASIFGDLYWGYIYVPNTGSHSISVIDTNDNTVIKNIRVGKYPTHIFGDLDWSNLVYVSNSGSGLNNGTITVIDYYEDLVKKNIPVGNSPRSIFGDLSSSDLIYVPNYGSDTVSVIDTTNNTLVKNIPVGYGPASLFVDPSRTDAIYVANYGSAGVSVINSVRNELVAGVTFSISPFSSGGIVCDTDRDDLDAPINRLLYVNSGTKCIAKPNKGFEFSSWGETFDDNSTRTINASSGSPFTALLDTLNLKPDDPAANLIVNRFGNFTAYFRALPPAIPSEYWIPLYGIIVSTVVGWSIPSIISSHRSKKQIKRLNSYHQEMNSLYDDGKLDESDFNRLDILNHNISDAYSEGKINNEQYMNLRKEISILYEEIYKKRIESTHDLSRLREDIADAYSKDKISEIHYKLLNERISKITSMDDAPDST